jgi:hypothetical protein
MIGDLVTLNVSELSIAEYVWRQSIDRLIRAAQVKDSLAANMALDEGGRAAVRAYELTGGHPDTTLVADWKAAIEAWNNAGLGLSYGGNGVPWWVWAVFGVGLVATWRGGRVKEW